RSVSTAYSSHASFSRIYRRPTGNQGTRWGTKGHDRRAKAGGNTMRLFSRRMPTWARAMRCAIGHHQESAAGQPNPALRAVREAVGAVARPRGSRMTDAPETPVRRRMGA